MAKALLKGDNFVPRSSTSSPMWQYVSHNTHEKPQTLRVNKPYCHEATVHQTTTLSVTTAISTRSSIEFFHESCIIHFKLPNGDFEIIKLPQRRHLYATTICMSNPVFVIGHTSTHTPHLTKALSTLMWHCRFDHINSATLTHDEN